MGLGTVYETAFLLLGHCDPVGASIESGLEKSRLGQRIVCAYSHSSLSRDPNTSLRLFSSFGSCGGCGGN